MDVAPDRADALPHVGVGELGDIQGDEVIPLGRQVTDQVDPEETGAEHCQHDNPTLGQEVLADWLADRFGIDQRALLTTSINPLI